MRVDKIGKALFPEPPREIVHALSPTDTPNAAPEPETDPYFDDPDFYHPF
jgi:hypothetical protein